MALLFGGASSDVVDCGSATVIDDFSAHTIVAWIYPTSLAATRIVATKATVALAYKQASVRNTGQLDHFVRGTTSAGTARSANSAGNILTTDKWWFVAFVISSGFVPKLFLGDLTTAVVETAYATQTTGAGSVDPDASANFRIGNAPALGSAFVGRIAAMQYHNAELSLAELRVLQGRMTNRSTGKLWIELHGTGTQIDLSGNGNAGTVSGATVAPHVPLGPLWGFGDQDHRIVAPTPLSIGADGSGAPLFSRQVGIIRTNTGTGTLTPTRVVGRISAYAATGAAAVVRFCNRSMAATGTGSASLSRLLTLLVGVDVGAVGSAAISKLQGLLRTFSAAGTGAANLTRDIPRTLGFSGAGAASLAAVNAFLVTVSAAASGAVEIGRALAKVLGVSALGEAALNAINLLSVTITATTISNLDDLDDPENIENWDTLDGLRARIIKQVHRAQTFGATGTGAVQTVLFAISVAILAGATSSVSIARSLTRSMSFSATGVYSLRRVIARRLAMLAASVASMLTELGARVIPPERVFHVGRERRAFIVAAESRAFIVARQTRTFTA